MASNGSKAGRGDDQYMIRFPKGMKDAIKDAADRNGRSMNSEIIARLEQSYRGGGDEIAIGVREKAFEDALQMLKFSMKPMKFKVVLDE